ncbi:MAG: hypothetical protein ACLKAO_11305 [Alkaliphilus sp.]
MVKDNNIIDSVESGNEDIQKIIEKAVLEPEFKNKLIEDPDTVLKDYNISEIGKIMIKSLSEEDYDKLTPENIDEYFSADSAIYTPDFDEDIPLEYSDEDDI